MIKNLIIILILCFLVVSCGKKGDPRYIEPEKNVKKIILKKKV
tara:strand:+ start:1403 stop:1531 length:129 start_codon:yes stop_codon:yes gene_type:complete